MHRLEFERAAGRAVGDEEYRKIELVYMNTDAIISTDQIARIYKELGMEGIDILYSLVMERGRLIETVGGLRSELSSVKREVRCLKRFRDEIIKEAERVDIGIPSRYWEPQPETEEELNQAAEVAAQKQRESGMPEEWPEIPFE